MTCYIDASGRIVICPVIRCQWLAAFIRIDAVCEGEFDVALGSNLVLWQKSGVTSVGEGTIIYVDVDDLRSCWQNLQRLAYANVSEIKERSQRSSFTCRDPDVRTVEVFQR
jgi:hypothetical protein